MLCVAVMLSVMVLGAGAAFSDQDQIENTEAVDACSALNIIGGYEDGSFHPERNIKRSEITKMICVALNGGQEPNVGTNEVPTFTDVRGTADAWAEGYIESCVAQGIVSGVGGGRFSPAGNVTGSQLAKMLLVCLGYNSDNEGFTGNAWETNVNVRAAQKGLYAGLSNMDTSAAVTRDQAAQMVWNALNAYEVEYKTTIVTDENGNLVTQVTVQDKVVGSNNDKITLLKDKYNAWVNVGTLTEIDGSSLTITMSASDKSVSDFVEDGKDTVTFSKVGVDYSSLMGQKVKVMFKDGKTNEVLGVYATDDNTIYTVNANAVEADGTTKIKFNGTTYNVELKGADNATTSGTDALLTYIDGTAANGYTTAELDAMDTSANVLTFVDTDGNNKIDSVYVKTVTVAKVTYASDSQIVAGGTTYKTADENIVDGLAKDDWVVITENVYNDNKDIVKADVTEALIQGYKAATSGDYHQYRVDNTWYNTADNKQLDAKAGDTAKIVVYNGIIFYADKVSGTTGVDNIAVVIDTGSFNQAKLAFFDGTTKTVTLDTDGTTNPTKGTPYVYTVNGEEYELSALTDANLDNDDYTVMTNRTIQNSNGVAWSGTDKAAKIGDVAISDDAQVILYGSDKNDSKLITGKQFKTLSYNAGYEVTGALTSETAGLTKVTQLVVTMGTIPSEFQTNDNYAYVIEKSYEVDSDYIGYTIFDGEKTIEVTEKNSIASRNVGDIVGYSSISEENVISDVTRYVEGGYTYASIRGVNDAADEVTFDGSTTRNITADTKIILIDSEGNNDYDQVGVPGSTISKDNVADKIGDTDTYMINAKYIADGADGDDADLAVLVVDVVNNAIAGGTKSIDASTLGTTGAALTTALTGTEEQIVVNGNIPATMITGITVPAGKTLVINGDVTLGAKWTVNGALVVGGELDLNGLDPALDGAGTVNGKTLVAGSAIQGSLTLSFANAIVKDDCAIGGTATLNITGSVTNTNADAVVTINGATLNVDGTTATNLTVTTGSVTTGPVVGDVIVNGGTVVTGNVTGNVTATSGTTTTGSVSGNLTASGDANVTTGAVSGTVDNSSSGNVSTGGVYAQTVALRGEGPGKDGTSVVTFQYDDVYAAAGLTLNGYTLGVNLDTLVSFANADKTGSGSDGGDSSYGGNGAYSARHHLTQMSGSLDENALFVGLAFGAPAELPNAAKVKVTLNGNALTNDGLAASGANEIFTLASSSVSGTGSDTLDKAFVQYVPFAKAGTETGSDTADTLKIADGSYSFVFTWLAEDGSTVLGTSSCTISRTSK